MLWPLRRTTWRVAAVLVAGNIVTGAFAALDQDNIGAASDFGAFLEDVSGTAGDNAYQAQTFTVGLAGILDRVEVQVGLVDDVAGSFPLYIYPTAAGVPDFTAAPLAMGTASYDLTGPADSQVVSVDLSGSSLAVSPGDVLALVAISGELSATTGPATLNWLGASTDPYAGGQYFAAFLGTPTDVIVIDPDDDLLFRTFVTVPEPGGAALFTAGLWLLTRRRVAVG